MRSINFKKNAYAINFVRKNPKSYVSSIVLSSLIDENIPKDTIISLYSGLSFDLKNNEFSRLISDFINNKSN